MSIPDHTGRVFGPPCQAYQPPIDVPSIMRASGFDEGVAAERAAIVKWLIIQSSDYLPLCTAIRDGEHLK